MRITFQRFPDHAVAHSLIERDDGVVYRMQEFSRGGTELPHDLRHLIVERELGISDGIWGCIAAGAVYQSMQHVSGRRPACEAKRSDALKKVQRERIMRAELFANLVEAVAKLDHPSVPEIQRLTRQKLSAVPLSEPGQDPADIVALPSADVLLAAATALQVAAARWARLRVGEELAYEWRPAALPRAPAAVPRPREPSGRRSHRGGR